MTSTSKGKGKKPVKKLRLNKDTIKDLDVKRAARKVKGGIIIEMPSHYVCTITCFCTEMKATCACTVTCLYTCYCRR